jgi:hypothetical protein
MLIHTMLVVKMLNTETVTNNAGIILQKNLSIRVSGKKPPLRINNSLNAASVRWRIVRPTNLNIPIEIKLWTKQHVSRLRFSIPEPVTPSIRDWRMSGEYECLFA